MYVFIFLIKVTEWPPIGKIAAHCLIVSLVFSHLGFWSGNLFLIAPFPDLCLLVPFYAHLRFRLYSQNDHPDLTAPLGVNGSGNILFASYSC